MSKLVVLVAMLVVVMCSDLVIGNAAPLRASSSVTISPTSAACSESGGELNLTITASPGPYSSASITYHTITGSGVDLAPNLGTYIFAPTTYNKHFTWTADSNYFWEQATSYSFIMKIILKSNNVVLDTSDITLKCSQRYGVILEYSNN